MTKPYSTSIVFLILLTSWNSFSQRMHYYGSKNDEGKYCIIEKNLDTKEKKELTPYKYYHATVIGEYFLLVERSFPYNDEKGNLYGHYYEGYIVNKKLEVQKHFDTIHTNQLTWASLYHFEFKEGGKVGYYSDLFKGRKWTDLYDNIELTKKLRTPAHKHRQPAYVATSGNTVSLINTVGVKVADLKPGDQVEADWDGYFKINRAESQSWEIVDHDGEVLAKDIVRERSCSDNSLLIYTHSDSSESVWFGTKQIVSRVPYKLNEEISRKSKTFIAIDDMGSYVEINNQGSVLQGPYEGLVKLRYGDCFIKESSIWRLEGEGVEEFSDRRFDNITPLVSSSKVIHYLLRQGEESYIFAYNGKSSVMINSTGIEVMLVNGEIVGEKGGKLARLAATEFGDFIYNEISYPSNYSLYMLGRIDKAAVLINSDGEPLFADRNLKEIEFHNCEVGDIFELTGKEVTGYFKIGTNPDEVEFIYEDFECGYHGYCLKKDGKWGLIDFYGKQLLDFEHKKLKNVQEYEPDE